MKKKLLIIFIVFLTVFFIGSISSAAAYDFETNSGIDKLATGAGYNLNATSTEEYIGKILLLAFSFVGVIFMMLTIYAGIQWMTAQGNTSQVSKAKDTLIKAIVGLVIIMAAYGITYLVINTFQAPVIPESAHG